MPSLFCNVTTSSWMILGNTITISSFIRQDKAPNKAKTALLTSGSDVSINFSAICKVSCTKGLKCSSPTPSAITAKESANSN